MRSFLRSGLVAFSFLMFSILPSVLYAQTDTVTCYSAAAGGPYDSTDIGRFIIGKDTIGSVYSHLANAAATNSYVFYTSDTIKLFVDSTYHLQEAGIMNTLNDANARVSVFIDYNHNQYYDVNERVWVANATAYYNYILDTSIIIPGTAMKNVPCRMRVILNNDTTTPADPACGYYTSGETWDFVVMFKGVTTSVKNLNSNKEISFYPNPGSGKFTMSCKADEAVRQLQLKISTMSGQMVMSRTYENTGTQFSADIDLGGVAKGLYFIESMADGERQLNKILIQ